VKARRLSQAVMRNIRQNLFFAFIYNALGVPVAAGVLYPVAGILLSPIIAAAAMALSSVSVIGNALRLRQVWLWQSDPGNFPKTFPDSQHASRGACGADAQWRIPIGHLIDSTACDATEPTAAPLNQPIGVSTRRHT